MLINWYIYVSYRRLRHSWHKVMELPMELQAQRTCVSHDESFWFVIGITAGSVANAIIYRLPRGIVWHKGRSICPNCKHNLSFLDLIPVLSFIFLGAKCRYCKKPIPWRYFYC